MEQLKKYIKDYHSLQVVREILYKKLPIVFTEKRMVKITEQLISLDSDFKSHINEFNKYELYIAFIIPNVRTEEFVIPIGSNYNDLIEVEKIIKKYMIKK